MARGKSLRWRLTLPHIVILLTLLFGLGVFQYVSLRQSLITQRAETLNGDVDAARTLFSRPANRGIGFKVAASRYGTVITALTGRDVTIGVYDQSHQQQAVTPDGGAIPELPASLFDSADNGTGHSDPTVIRNGATSQLVIAYPLSLANNGKGFVVLAASMEDIDQVLRRQLFLLALGSILALVAAGVVGAVVTKRGLMPLARLTATAGELAHGDLRARSRIEHGDDEVGELGHAIDDMAERIEAAFTAQAQSEAQMRRFIADASHELRTPVTSLKGYIDVMRRGAARDPAALDAVLESMQREADRMRMLVLDLLQLARLDADRKLDITAVDASVLVEGVLNEGLPGLPSDLRRDLAAGCIARADSNALTTIVRNLLVNACKYAPGAAQVWSTTSDGSRVLIRCSDAGPGIPASDLPHIFDRFYRGEKMRAREEGGSGLGLSIVQGLAQAMGGDISVTSGEGHGTTMTVTLPRAN